ncbi:MAG: F0F1 ATP synthase subunit delta [Coprobacillus sp.]|nr:F0F1 ATP synthase subunit delta [Coprobacillus sp.]
MSELTKRYAYGLFDLIKNEGDFLDYKEEARILRTIFSDNPDFVETLNSRFLTNSEKHEIINSTLKDFHPYMVSFISLVVDNHRMTYIDDILYDFISAVNDKIGIKEGLLYSTYHLSEQELSEVEKSISKLEKGKVELRNVIDTSLIGGIKVLVGDKVYDGSIKNKLNSLKLSLLGGRS